MVSGQYARNHPQVAMHNLFTNPYHPPILQKRRKFTHECSKLIEEEVAKLIKAYVIREAHSLDWFTNVVVAPQKREK